MAATLTMPDNLDAVGDSIPAEADEDAILLKVHDAIEAETEAETQAAFDAEVSASDELPGHEVDGAAILENITGQTLDQLADEMYGQAKEGESELPSESNVEDAAAPAPAPRFSATDDFLIQIQNAETECRRTEAVVVDLKEQLKDAKAEYNASVSKLRKLAIDGATMIENDAQRPLLAVAEAAAETSSVESPEAESPAPSIATEPDTSRDWPPGRVPSLIECLIADEKLNLKAGENWNCTVEADGVCLDESTYLGAGEFSVVEWRDQADTDTLPHFVEAYRAEQSIAAESDDSWRAFRVCDLADLSDGTVGALNNADLDTLGKLADYTASGRLLGDVPKLGPKKVEQIENALEKFWKERPDRKVAGE